jgi:hypothetical protein
LPSIYDSLISGHNHFEIIQANTMGTEQSLSRTTSRSVERKAAAPDNVTGVVETVKQAAQAEKARARAKDDERSEEERLAATQAASIYGRRAMLKAFSTILSAIPGQGAALSSVVDGANNILDKLDGDPEKLEKEALRKPAPKKQATESFMRGIREQAAAEQLPENTQANGVQP